MHTFYRSWETATQKSENFAKNVRFILMSVCQLFIFTDSCIKFCYNLLKNDWKCIEELTITCQFWKKFKNINFQRSRWRTTKLNGRFSHAGHFFIRVFLENGKSCAAHFSYMNYTHIDQHFGKFRFVSKFSVPSSLKGGRSNWVTWANSTNFWSLIPNMTMKILGKIAIKTSFSVEFFFFIYFFEFISAFFRFISLYKLF